MKNKTRFQHAVWVAVRVERGFVEEARLFATVKEAVKVAEEWRAASNPDYDEVGVVRSTLPIPSRGTGQSI